MLAETEDGCANQNCVGADLSGRGPYLTKSDFNFKGSDSYLKP